nr:hypothetical protein [Tanacetum cinerariifolium]
MTPKKAAPKRTTRLNPGATSNPNQAPSTTTTTVTNAQLQAMIDQGVNAALAARDANRTGDDSHTSGTGVRRTERVTRDCTYQDFIKFQPLYFKGTEGVVELTQWFEMTETVFCISNCLAEKQVKFATCTLLAGALTWWNSHVRIVGNDAAYVMTWIELKKKMADKYCPRNEMKKIETEFWNLEVQGIDVRRYNQYFQELALLCVRTCPEESGRVERYIGGSLLNHDSSIIPSSSKINSLLDEFADELTLHKSIPPGINETDYHPENEIRLSQRLLYDNSSPRPPKEFVSENSNADAESFSPFMEEIDLHFTPDDPMPPSIEEDDDESRDILIRKELLDKYSLPLPENESFHFDIPSFSHPPVKPPDGKYVASEITSKAKSLSISNHYDPFLHSWSLMKGTSSVPEYGRKFKALCDQLVGQPVADVDKNHWFLCGLGPSFETFFTAQRTVKPRPSFRDLLSQAEGHELFIKSVHGSSSFPATTVAFVAESGRSSSSSGCGFSPRGGRGGRSGGHGRGRRPPYCQCNTPKMARS